MNIRKVSLLIVVLSLLLVEAQALKTKARGKIVSVRKSNTTDINRKKITQFRIIGYQRGEFFGRMKLKVICRAGKQIYYGETSMSIPKMWKDSTYTKWKVNFYRDLGKERGHLIVLKYKVEYLSGLGEVLGYKGKRNMERPSNAKQLQLFSFSFTSSAKNSFTN